MIFRKSGSGYKIIVCQGYSEYQATVKMNRFCDFRSCNTCFVSTMMVNEPLVKRGGYFIGGVFVLLRRERVKA